MRTSSKFAGSTGHARRAGSIRHGQLERRIRLGIFFSHPTQHHSILFQELTKSDALDVWVHYYDPGASGQMYDPGYQVSQPWDVDVLGGTQYRVLPNILRGRQPSPMRQLNPGVISAMRGGRFDAVLLFGYVSPSNRLVLALAKAMGAEVLYQSDTNVLDARRAKRSRLRDWYRESFLKRVDTVLVIGDKNREAYRLFGVEDKKLLWCPCPVDIKRFEAARTDPRLPSMLVQLRQKYDIPSDAHVVAFCGKLIPRKRPADLIDALRSLNRRDVYGLIIGSGPLEVQLRQSLTHDDRVRITGFVNQASIPYHMLLADLAVVASDHDAHPLVTTEFAACGTPVLVSHYCGVWGDNDVLRPGENGDVYECGNIAALSRGIAALIDNDSLRARMSLRASELASAQAVERAAQVIVDHLVAHLGA